MKQFIIAIIFITTSVFTSATATENNIPKAIVTSFTTTFTHAENVKWAVTGNFTIATFTMEEATYSAYYYADGTLAVMAQNISWKQLPRSLKVNLEEKATLGHILAIYKMESEEGIRFYCEVQTAEGKEILTASGSRWKVVNK